MENALIVVIWLYLVWKQATRCSSWRPNLYSLPEHIWVWAYLRVLVLHGYWWQSSSRVVSIQRPTAALLQQTCATTSGTPTGTLACGCKGKHPSAFLYCIFSMKTLRSLFITHQLASQLCVGLRPFKKCWELENFKLFTPSEYFFPFEIFFLLFW